MYVLVGWVGSISSKSRTSRFQGGGYDYLCFELQSRCVARSRGRQRAPCQRATARAPWLMTGGTASSGKPEPSDEREGKSSSEPPAPKYRAEELLAWLESADPTTRLRAVLACRHLTAVEAAPVLEKAVRINEPEVQNRSFAALALGYLPNERSYELLSGILRNDISGEVRSSAAAALGYLGERRAVPELRIALLEDFHWSTRISAAVSLGLLQDERAFDALVDGLRLARRYRREEGNALKRACLGSLGELGMPQAVSHLVFYAQERDFLTRQVLAEALGRLLHRTRRLEADRMTQRQLQLARECLEYLARDDHENVRRAAQLALANLSVVSD